MEFMKCVYENSGGSDVDISQIFRITCQKYDEILREKVPFLWDRMTGCCAAASCLVPNYVIDPRT
jgi:hypothetical protein